MLSRNIENREKLIEALRNELIGPIPVFKDRMRPLKIAEVVEFKTKEEMFDFYYDADTGEEILQVNTPVTQYSAGLLFPLEAKKDDIDDNQNTMEETDEPDGKVLGTEAVKQLQDMENRGGRRDPEAEEEEEIPDLMPGKNDFAPSSMALSFYVRMNDNNDRLRVRLAGGVYRPFKVKIEKEDRMYEWWHRMPAVFREKPGEDSIEFKVGEFAGEKRCLVEKTVSCHDLQFLLQMYSRMLSDGEYLITLSATNITRDREGKKLRDMEKILLQSELTVELSGEDAQFLPYPSTLHSSKKNDEEVLSAQLLYRNAKNYALGHGCSADWELDQKGKPLRIRSTFMPEYETLNMTPDIRDENGNEFSISMLDLAGVVPDAAPPATILGRIVSEYEKWIEARENEIPEIEDDLRKTAQKHMYLCRKALTRMKKGLKCLKDRDVLSAFQLANHAMAIQQVVGTDERGGKHIGNRTVMDEKLSNYGIPKPEEIIKKNRGKWRAFQAAFLLMLLPSFHGDDREEREIVDLIWFPTGGGKTEAYLGVAAFSMFYRRLKNKEDAGTDVIMRYTLRLLTADQFQRSSRLLCAMDMLRRENPDRLGNTPFSIGIWLGSKTTPNRNKGGTDSAQARLNEWKSANDRGAFIVKNCPWCGAKLGAYPVEMEAERQSAPGGTFSRGRRTSRAGGSRKNTIEITGYEFSNRENRLKIYCPDDDCPFHHEIPVYIVDETIYDVRPTFIIGTVDKFTMLSWRPQARRLFGLNMQGERELSPPNLIIQDELHLISGPLGSMTGLYEILVEELCTDRRNDREIKPKIICATATIRGFKEQIEGLFARDKDKAYLFPGSGLSYDDSFFARTHMDENGKPSKGRKYVGVLSNMVGLQTLQVKVYSTLLQKVTEFEEEERDPFWTLLSFYNSIRELGGSLTLFQTDIPSYFLQLKNKHHIKDKRFQRYLNSFKELTSRLDSGEVAEAIQILKRNYGGEEMPVDVCLASNIIEVGVDIDRLSLMSVIGQPKNTAQYIQVTGRVGRRWFERPGLVVTLYKSSISRDKSHFEHFKEYHQKLYTHVEATSVTPFSEPCMERGLYGVIIGWLRQFHDAGIASSPENIKEYEAQLDKFKKLFLDRVRKVDESQQEVAQELYERYVRHMFASHAQRWEDDNTGESYFLMYPAGSHISEYYERTARPVPTSMRNVDASCQGTITNEYLLEEQNEH